MENQTFSWETFENHSEPRSRFWAIGILTFFGIGASIAFLVKNPLFGVIIIIGGLTILGMGLKKGKILNILLKEDRITINDEETFYQKIDHFWITNITKPETLPHLLILKLKDISVPEITVPISPEIDLINLRLFLQNKITEQEIKGPYMHHIIDQLGI